MIDKNIAKTFIIGKKIKCFNEEKPIKIMGDMYIENDKLIMPVYSGQAHWDGEKWEYISDYSLLCKVIMGK